MHRLSSFVLLAVLCLGDLWASSVRAGQDQAIENEEYTKPDVEIDRSVLKDLQGYEPPPMFGASSSRQSPAPESLTRPPTTPPDTPVLTQPKAEDLLNHPVANTGVLVLTIPQDLLPATRSSEQTELPVPTGKKTVSRNTQKKEKGRSEKPAAKTASTPPKNTPQKPQKKVEKKIEKKAVENTEKALASPAPVRKDLVETIKATPLSPVSAEAAYKPKTGKTMPAVPPITVERSKLDPFNLPTTAQSVDESGSSKTVGDLTPPTPGERLMDQALTARMVPESDPALKKAVSGVAEKIAPAESPLISLEFKPKLSELQTDQKNFLDSDVVARLKKSESSRLQIQAFAKADKQEHSTARRVSLSRGLSVRSYLLEKGIPASRIDVRALGDNTLEPPIDRVDLIFIKSK